MYTEVYMYTSMSILHPGAPSIEADQDVPQPATQDCCDQDISNEYTVLTIDLDLRDPGVGWPHGYTLENSGCKLNRLWDQAEAGVRTLHTAAHC